ncbi:MAG: zf-HC2 domain-containing protein [Anaerolineae bacterium]|nr:zf-HC2 domain-containing protein [Gemmatimonadaceae bacterium]
MNDCPRADIRDMLPDWIHGTLDPTSVALVTAHVAQCADCAAEADLLRAARAALARAPRIDTGRIAAAVNAARAQPRELRRRWPAVAGIFAVAAGIAVVMFGGGPERDSGTMTASVDTGVAGSATVPIGGSAPAQVLAVNTGDSAGSAVTPGSGSRAGQPQLVMGGGITDLVDQELEALLGVLDGVEAIPSAVPEPVMSLPVGTSATEGLL